MFPSGPDILEAIPIILSLIIIEGLLSVDNALAIAALASHLPEKQKYLALKLGIVGAYVFRGVALGFATWIISNQWVRLLGAGYLLYLMCLHLSEGKHGGEVEMKKKPGLLMTVLQIEIMDLSLSIDNVVAAVAMSQKLWVVCVGVFIGILALRYLAGYCIRLLEKYPVLGATAFLLVGYVGVILLVEEVSRMMGGHLEIHSTEKFIGLVVIIGLAMLYSRSRLLQAVFDPLIFVAKPVMRLFAGAVGLVFWPFRKILEAVKPAALEAIEPPETRGREEEPPAPGAPPPPREP